MNLKLRWIIIAVVVAWSVFSVLPMGKQMKLGLDLQGGMHVILGVETDKAVEARIDSYVTKLRKELSAEKIDFSYVQVDDRGRLNISLKNDEAFSQVKEIITNRYPSLEEIASGNPEDMLSFRFTETAVKRIKESAVEQSLEVVRNRIDEFGVSEPVIQRQGRDQIVVQLPGITEPEKAISLIGKTAQLKFHIVNENVTAEDVEKGNIPANSRLLYQRIVDQTTGQTIQKVPYVVHREAVLSGDYLVDAQVNFSQNNMPIVEFTLDSAGSKLFEEVTGENVGKRMAIVLDDNVYSAPTIKSRIAGGSAYIDGMANLSEAKEIAIVLRAGSLPAPVEIEENRTVGPSLGQDSINKGFKAAIIGVIAIMLFMLVYYRLAGLVADLALTMNFLIIFGVMSQFEATLTLPGIAGLILTIGMSVDANVLIFERVREELRLGRTPFNAIEYGYEKALSTILDANITTIIAAVVLFQFGTGPIKGFAVTLSIGILASLFTAIFFTRTLFAFLLRRGDNTKLSI
ncbi:protein translocase subunit SecD [Limisalsivibrio acetivorans]|uniref:protein translocase subunit SecD n=1 Tax=Limisalsivibrio acetivorans TaxID=1304888 RepID=UPI0003B6A3D2|nr:protein translocase subunit SecD [Limisalsivibrio acetivorans]